MGNLKSVKVKIIYKEGFLLNGKRPSEFDVLRDGDELNLIG